MLEDQLHNIPALDQHTPKLRAPRELTFDHRPVLAPRRRDHVADEEMEMEPREMPGAIWREWQGAEDTREKQNLTGQSATYQ